jgi:hypothetical protein
MQDKIVRNEKEDSKKDKIEKPIKQKQVKGK